jgi:hypothetical protein
MPQLQLSLGEYEKKGSPKSHLMIRICLIRVYAISPTSLLNEKARFHYLLTNIMFSSIKTD